ncbi:MAG: hypothetical protein H6502_00565 [Candidatus Woesearchaeota archaeon]|nr:MAG: hypothetical protein H6502_00565 [Candidatus Woesearchaeota archaeon]
MRWNKRGQAALEFLTTYGWAFLVILVMIGALSYFGILSPDRFTSERCNFGTEVVCNKDEALLTAADTETLRVKLQNKMGNAVTITGFEITATDGSFSNCVLSYVDTNNDFSFDTTVDGPEDFAGATMLSSHILQNNEFEDFRFDCAGQDLPTNRKVPIEAKLTYQTQPGFDKDLLGELYLTAN